MANISQHARVVPISFYIRLQVRGCSAPEGELVTTLTAVEAQLEGFSIQMDLLGRETD